MKLTILCHSERRGGISNFVGLNTISELVRDVFHLRFTTARQAASLDLAGKEND